MNPDAQLPEDHVGSLDQRTLLGLAIDANDSVSQKYQVPELDQIRRLFPDLDVQEAIGSGGMGCVFRATQKKLNRTVALKILPSELARDALFAERFAREARAMARLNHPNIVSVFDFGQTGDLHYLTMEHMDGMNLRELLDSGPLDAVTALRIFEQICLALAYAHQEGVIHRDIKPENILFTRSGHLGLADFGLARLALDSNCEVSLTQTRQAMGTLHYMAPEQWENPKAVDHRADIYALGILLYELLTGRVPRGSFPPASTLCDVDANVDATINKALQVNPADRFLHVADMMESLVPDKSGTAKYQFGTHGTVTNFMHLGEAVLRHIPRPGRSGKPIATSPRYTELQYCLTALALATLLMFLPWESHQMGIETTTMDFLGSFEVSNCVMLGELLLLCLLTWKREQIHPARSRVLSLFVCGFCIAQVAVFIFNRNNSDEQARIASLIFLFVVALLALELFVGTVKAVFRWAWRIPAK